MKNHNNYLTEHWILILSFLILFNSTAKAQYYEVPLNKKVENSILAIEGEVVESVPFYANDKIYTSNKIEIFNCFLLKNNSILAEGTECSEIYVITKGGSIGEASQTWSHALQLFEGNIGFYYLTETERPSLYSDLPSLEVYAGEQGFIEYNADDNKNFYASNVFATYTNPEEDLIIPTLEYSANGYNGEKSFLRDYWMLSFQARNFYIVNNDLFFDLALKSRWGNKFSINDLSFDFKYNSDLFGESPLTSGKIELHENEELNASGNEFNFQESQENKINIGVSKSAFTNLDFVDNNYLTILTAKVNIEGINLQELEVPEFILEDGNFQIFNSEGSIINVNEKAIDVELGGLSTCFLDGTLTSVNPDNGGAGIRADEAFVNGNTVTSGIVTINGCGFGDLVEENFCDNLPGTGNGNRVEFNLFGADWVTPLCTDYIKWDDDQIIVRIPSHGHRVNYFFGIPTVSDPTFNDFASSGDVRVRTEGPNPVGSETLTIDFVHRNGRFNNDNDHPTASRALLKGRDAEEKGYELYFTQAFKDNLGVSGQNAFIRALNTWRCETLVNFEIKEFSEITNPEFACAIDYGLLQEGSNGDTEVLGFTPPDITDCSVFQVDDAEVLIKSFSITFSNAKDWHTSISDVVSGKVDLETVALHELGHALQLFHVDNDGAVMERIASVQRRILTLGDINGGIHVVQVSNQEPVCAPPMIPISVENCITNTTSLVEDKKDFDITPNPSSDKIYLSSFPDKTEKLSLYSIDGRLLIEKNISPFDDQIEINLSPFPAGVYTISITALGEILVQKIIKQ